MKKEISFLKLILLVLISLDLIVWYHILFSKSINDFELYFLKVGQGDSSLAILPDQSGGFVKVLIDGGPINGGLDANLDKILKTDRYIDLIFISHPQTDHYGGLIDVVKKYDVGAVLYNGEESSSNNWEELNKLINDKKIGKIALSVGDMVNYAVSDIRVLNSFNFSVDTNNSALVLMLDSNGVKTLYTGDIDADTETMIADKEDLIADILKVSHHGSKYSSDINFLKEVNPKISIIEVGKNSYGHPAKSVLERLTLVGSKVFNTYEHGMIKIIREGGNLKVFSYVDI